MSLNSLVEKYIALYSGVSYHVSYLSFLLLSCLVDRFVVRNTSWPFQAISFGISIIIPYHLYQSFARNIDCIRISLCWVCVVQAATLYSDHIGDMSLRLKAPGLSSSVSIGYKTLVCNYLWQVGNPRRRTTKKSLYFLGNTSCKSLWKLDIHQNNPSSCRACISQLKSYRFNWHQYHILIYLRPLDFRH